MKGAGSRIREMSLPWGRVFCHLLKAGPELERRLGWGLRGIAPILSWPMPQAQALPLTFGLVPAMGTGSPLPLALALALSQAQSQALWLALAFDCALSPERPGQPLRRPSALSLPALPGTSFPSSVLAGPPHLPVPGPISVFPPRAVISPFCPHWASPPARPAGGLAPRARAGQPVRVGRCV